MKTDYQVVSVQWEHPQLSGQVTLCQVFGSGTAEIPVPAHLIHSYRIGRRVTISVRPK